MDRLTRAAAAFLLTALLLALFLAQLAAAAPPAAAAAISVTTQIDELNADGDCSLREAIATANAASQVDNCAISGSGPPVISLPAGSYFLTLGGSGEDANAGGDLDILTDVTIQGAGMAATFIDANLLDRVFDIDPADSVTIAVTITGVTIQNGQVFGADGGGIRNFDDALTLLDMTVADNRLTGASMSIANGGGVFSGGGVFTGRGTLHIINSIIEDNSSSFGSGGGIYNNGGLVQISGSIIRDNSASVTMGTSSGGGLSNVGGTVNITGSAILNNFADGQAGGILNFFSTAGLNVTNSTISGNRTAGSGGGIRNIGQLHLSFSTITGNVADDDVTNDVGDGGGLRNNGTAVLKANIFYNNSDNTTPGSGDIFPDIQDTGTLTSTGYNFLGIITGTTTISHGVNHDMVGFDPLLGSLAGSLPHHPLAVASPAVNIIPLGDCTLISGPGNPLFTHGAANTRDQIGTPRPHLDQPFCDAGAIEARHWRMMLPAAVHLP